MEWLLPANLHFYRVDEAFSELRVVDWTKTRNLAHCETGDIVYIYESAPVSAIVWKCIVTDAHLEAGTIDDSAYYINPKTTQEALAGAKIRVAALNRYENYDELTYKKLVAHSLKSTMQGAIRVSPELSAYINSIPCNNECDGAGEIIAATLSDEELFERAKNADSVSKTKEVIVLQHTRDAWVSAYAKRNAKGMCALCNNAAPFADKGGNPYLETHHIVWLANGGEDSIYNTVALCPNCHKKMHIVNDADDVSYLKAKAAAKKV